MPSTRCKAITAKGARCKNRTLANSGFCRIHQKYRGRSASPSRRRSPSRHRSPSRKPAKQDVYSKKGENVLSKIL